MEPAVESLIVELNLAAAKKNAVFFHTVSRIAEDAQFHSGGALVKTGT